jgi:hypothetical protein
MTPPARSAGVGTVTTAPAPIPRGRAPLRRWALVLAALVLAVAAGVVAGREWGGGTTSSSVVQGSGVPATQVRALPPFTSVELGGSNAVTVRVGGEQAVVVHADDNLVDAVTTIVRGGRLVVDDRGDFSTKSPMSVDVTVPELEGVALTGSGILNVSRAIGPRLTARLEGSGVLAVGGAVDGIDALLSGSGDMRLGDLVARHATAVVSGSGRITVNATESLDASVSGSGAILYGGDPARVVRRVTGSGAIVRR